MKFYVRSGDVRFIIDRNSHTEAIDYAIKNTKKSLSDFILVSEIGFDSFGKNDILMLTESV